jgi:hypothetical protein
MKLLLKSLALFVGVAFATPALAFNYSCADWKGLGFWKEATPAIIADCVQDMGFAMGFSVKDRTDIGATPLHYAAQLNSNPDVISALIEAGADGSIEDNDGKTPFDFAKNNEAIKNTDAYWALNEARFNKGVQPDLVPPPESSSVPIFEPHMIGGEIDAFITAVRACWLVEPGAEWARVIITVGFSLGQDGRVIGDVHLVGSSSDNDAQTATAFQAARRAILRCQRSGYKLPPEKYQSWQNMEMTFDASDMRLR